MAPRWDSRREIEVAAGVDREVAKRRELARGEVDCETFHDAA